ncbi:unnamed protein product [Adineta steineri]|uniref:Uncharacterized protein n=1 Tax=Adineta steineri TaxID=433720 RepID=A0A813XHA4_9BILA|nr:unnamed protein product [Adineta steineri]CAF1179905.1 unnamed protein product [Adineta steineri]CAF1234897.1 unnamed protein product [Adineta steineri]
MLLVDLLSQSNTLQTLTTNDNNNELFESIGNDNLYSISTIEIPLKSSQPILTVSSNNIFVNEQTKRKNQFVLIDDNLKKTFIKSPIKESIIDSLWYDKKQKLLLLTETKIFTYDSNTKIIQAIIDIKPMDGRVFKCFSMFNNECSLLIAYDEWGLKFIEKWDVNEDESWELTEKFPLNLSSNEFVGNMLTIYDNDDFNLAITIYNDFTEEWRMELRHLETGICFRTILLSRFDRENDYRMIYMENMI